MNTFHFFTTIVLLSLFLFLNEIHADEFILVHSGEKSTLELVTLAEKKQNNVRGGRRILSETPKVLSKEDISLSFGDGTARDSSERKVIGLVSMNQSDVNILKDIPGVIDVIENGRVKIAEATLLWNLDRIDQSFGLDGDFLMTNETGRNVDIYVVDTGVSKGHTQFTGRVESGRNALSDFGVGPGADIDCNSHGTHVASTAAGATFGIARNAKIVPVKVMDCDGTGSVFQTVMGLTWARDESTRRQQFFNRRGVVNLSLTSAPNTLIDEAVRSCVAAGLFVAVAAGNARDDACLYSPSRERKAFVVGATSEDDSLMYFSNSGACVDLYAPGENILGADPSSNVASTIKRGTSMAAPHVAGNVFFLN